MLRRGGAHLGRAFDRQCRELVELTDSRDVIGEDGDGDWEIVWERLYALRAAKGSLADENAALLRTNSNLRAALLAAALAVETRTDVPPSTVQAWRETAS